MKCNKGKCKALYLDKINPMHQERKGVCQLESSVAEMDLVLVDTKLTRSQKCNFVAKKAKGIESCMKQSTARKGGDTSPLTHLDCWVLRCGPHYKRD